MKKKHFVLATFLAYSGLFWLYAPYAQDAILFKRLSNALQDVLFRVRYTSEDLPASRDQLVIIAVDDESSSRLGLRWPWPRTTLANLVRELSNKGCSVIGMNFTFTGLEEGQEASTLDLADAISSHRAVVVGSTMEGERLVRPSSALVEAGAKYGFLEKIVDDDFMIRRSYLRRPYRHGGEEPSFPLALWRQEEASDQRMDDWTASDGSYMLNYLVKESDLKTVSAWKVLGPGVSAETLRGKTALVGITSSLLSEKHYTPIGLLSGLFVHANEWIALKEGRPLRVAPVAMGQWIAFFTGLALLGLFFIKRVWLAVVGYSMGLFVLLLAGQFFIARDVVLPIFLMISGPVISLLIGVAAHLLYLFLENRGLEKRVIQDKMTGLYTYDHLRLRLDDEWTRCVKMRLPVSVVMTDLDRFKNINDTLGHETGNQMILRAAAVIKESVRGYDVVSRYGGDEFVILLWHANRTEALAYRDRLRQSYHAMASQLDEPLLKTSSISIGVASFDPQLPADKERPKNPQDLVERADKDLFEDKESRRKPGESKR